MPKLRTGFRLSEMSTTNAVVSVLVVVVIITLFFIPELVSLSTSGDKVAQNSSASRTAELKPHSKETTKQGKDKSRLSGNEDLNQKHSETQENEQIGLFFDVSDGQEVSLRGDDEAVEPQGHFEEFHHDSFFGIANHEAEDQDQDSLYDDVPENFERATQNSGFGYSLEDATDVAQQNSVAAKRKAAIEERPRTLRDRTDGLKAISERLDQALPQRDINSDVTRTVQEVSEEPPYDSPTETADPEQQSATSRAAEFLRDPFSEARAALRGKDWESTRRAQLPKKPKRRSKEFEEALVDGPITWEALKSRPIKKVLRRAMRDANQVSRLIPEINPRSRFAVQTYIGGVSRVLKGVRDALSADQVPNYLTALDREVTEALTSENAERAVRQAWAKVSLSPITDPLVTQAYKESSVQPFDPRLRLTSVRVIQPSTRRGQYNPDGRVYVRFRGFVIGSEVKKVVVYKDGEKFRNIRLQRKADQDGRRFFKMAQHRYDKASVYTVEAIDKEENYFRKQYSFFPRAQRFPWGGVGNASYQIPFPEADPRIDAFFRVGQAQKSGGDIQNPNQIYVTF